jgi:hypothetical protein
MPPHSLGSLSHLQQKPILGVVIWLVYSKNILIVNQVELNTERSFKMNFPQLRNFKVTFPPNLIHIQDGRDPTPVPAQFLDTDNFLERVYDHPEQYERNLIIYINENLFTEFILELDHDDMLTLESYGLGQPVVVDYVKQGFEDIDFWQSIGTKWGLTFQEVGPVLEGSN